MALSTVEMIETLFLVFIVFLLDEYFALSCILLSSDLVDKEATWTMKCETSLFLAQKQHILVVVISSLIILFPCVAILLVLTFRDHNSYFMGLYVLVFVMNR